MDYENFLKLFVASDTDKPTMSQPSKVGDFVYATDGHACVKIATELIERDYEQAQGFSFPPVEKVFSAMAGRNEQIDSSINAKNLADFLSGVPTNTYCETCDYFAKKTCVKKGHELTFGHGRDVVRINGVSFMPKQIQRLIAVADLLQCEIVHVSKIEQFANHFSIGQIDVAVMPVDVRDEMLRHHEFSVK